MNLIRITNTKSFTLVLGFLVVLLILDNTVLRHVKNHLKVNDNDYVIRRSSTHADNSNASGNDGRGGNVLYDSILDELDILSGGPSSKTLNCTPPRVNFANIIHYRRDQRAKNAHFNYNDNNNIGGIPKIMHFSHKSRCLPQDLARTLHRWQSVLPDYSIYFHDDDAVARLIDDDSWKQEFPDLHRAMRCVLFKGAMKIDVWRVLLLYKYGGVYSDMDIWPTDNFNETTIPTPLHNETNNTTVISAFSFNDVSNRPSQWFLALEPKHPFMFFSIVQIIKNILAMDNMHYPKVVRTTGPEATKNGYAQFLTSNYTVKNPKTFHNDVILTGMYGKRVIKSSHYHHQPSLPSDAVFSKYGYHDTVTLYNTNQKVRRQDRIAVESGIPHWTETRKHAKLDLENSLPKLSCLEYLNGVDNGTIQEIKPFRRK